MPSRAEDADSFGRANRTGSLALGRTPYSACRCRYARCRGTIGTLAFRNVSPQLATTAPSRTLPYRRSRTSDAASAEATQRFAGFKFWFSDIQLTMFCLCANHMFINRRSKEVRSVRSPCARAGQSLSRRRSRAGREARCGVASGGRRPGNFFARHPV